MATKIEVIDLHRLMPKGAVKKWRVDLNGNYEIEKNIANIKTVSVTAEMVEANQLSPHPDVLYFDTREEAIEFTNSLRSQYQTMLRKTLLKDISSEQVIDAIWGGAEHGDFPDKIKIRRNTLLPLYRTVKTEKVIRAFHRIFNDCFRVEFSDNVESKYPKGKSFVPKLEVGQTVWSFHPKYLNPRKLTVREAFYNKDSHHPYRIELSEGAYTEVLELSPTSRKELNNNHFKANAIGRQNLYYTDPDEFVMDFEEAARYATQKAKEFIIE